jgi:peptidoglycan/LPS O-acetylase OafA/YrhL
MDVILWKPILGLSTISYSLYLIHYVVLERLFGGAKYDSVSVSTVSVALGKLGVCLLSGWGLYLLFERHTYRIKALLQNKPLKRVDSSGVMTVGSQP